MVEASRTILGAGKRLNEDVKSVDHRVIGGGIITCHIQKLQKGEYLFNTIYTLDGY
jgi:hypothetical protein